MLLPSSRGPITAQLIDALRADDADALPSAPTHVIDPLTDEDLQLALWICFELHYRGFDDCDADWEWQPELIRFRTDCEAIMLEHVRANVVVPTGDADVAARLRAIVNADDSPSLSSYAQRTATLEQIREFAVHRSIYHLKEADPHTWGIPRLSGRAKAALVEIQADEYAHGDQPMMHSELFRRTLRGLGLDDGYGHYLDVVPAATLAVNNLMSIFGLRRSLRGALVGHLAAYEMSSSTPSRRYSLGLRRLGLDEDTRRFYDEHVTADALHEQVAAHDMCGGLVEAEPDQLDNVLFGAAAALYVDGVFGTYMFEAWTAGRSTLRGAVEPTHEAELLPAS